MPSVIPDLDLLGILCNVAVDGLVDLISLSTCYPEDQVIERCTAEDIHMVTCHRRQLVHLLASYSQDLPVLGPPRGENRSGS